MRFVYIVICVNSVFVNLLYFYCFKIVLLILNKFGKIYYFKSICNFINLFIIKDLVLYLLIVMYFVIEFFYLICLLNLGNGFLVYLFRKINWIISR